MESLAARARRAFTDSDFREAEKLYTKAINVSLSSPNILHFDQRAACYEELHRLEDALKDGKRMLQLNARDARGYLRCGKIYQLMNKDQLALTWYKRGCDAVSKNDPLMKVMRKLHDMVEGRLVKKVPRRDPFEVLPLELVWEIFSYFSFPQKLVCLQISKKWNSTLTCDPRFYTKLDLVGYRSRPKVTSIETYIKKSRGKLEVLKTDVILKPVSLKHHFTLCRDLRILHLPWQRALLTVLPRARTLRQLVLFNLDDKYITLDEVRTLMVQLPHMKHFGSAVSTSNAHADHEPAIRSQSLRSLDIKAASSISTQELFLSDSAMCFQSLQELKLLGEWIVALDIDWPHSLQILRFPWPRASLSRGLQMILPAKLCALEIDCAKCPLSLSAPWPPLEALHLSEYTDGLSSQTWAHFGETLKRLHMHSARIESDVLSIILENIMHLQELTISVRIADALTDAHLAMISQRNPDLAYLNLAENRSFTGPGLVKLVQKLASLKELILDDCDQIDLEVATWIRRRRIRVRQNLHRLRR